MAAWTPPRQVCLVEAAPLRPTAPINEPPNQAAAPRSCMERMMTLLVLLMVYSNRIGANREADPGRAAAAN